MSDLINNMIFSLYYYKHIYFQLLYRVSKCIKCHGIIYLYSTFIPIIYQYICCCIVL